MQNLLNNENVAFLIKPRKTRLKACHNVENFLKENDIPYCVKYVDELSFEEIKYIVDSVSYDCKDLKKTILVSKGFDNRNVYANLYKYLLENNLIFDDLDRQELIKAIYHNKNLLKTPITIKNGIAVVDFREDLQQFLIGDRRNDLKWIENNPPKTAEEKIERIIKNFAIPKIAYFSLKKTNQYGDTKFYLPKTSALYGGKINWIYPNCIDENGNLIKYKKNFTIKMQVFLDNVFKEVDFNVRVKIKK